MNTFLASDCHDAIVYPIKGALALMAAHKDRTGLNLATVRRTQSWVWSTYTYLYDDLGPYTIEVQKWLSKLDEAINAFDFDTAEHTTDLWDIAMNHYMEHIED